MPIVIPTPDEVARMGKRERDRWRKRMGVVLRDAEQTRQLLSYGDVVREQAHLWERIYGLDPDWRAHRATLMEAVA